MIAVFQNGREEPRKNADLFPEFEQVSFRSFETGLPLATPRIDRFLNPTRVNGEERFARDSRRKPVHPTLAGPLPGQASDSVEGLQRFDRFRLIAELHDVGVLGRIVVVIAQHRYRAEIGVLEK